MSWQVIVNGEFLPEAEASVHISDLGLRRGYGAFEFFRVLGGTPIFLDDHLARLGRTIEMLGLDGKWTLAAIRDQVHAVISENGLTEAGVQIVLTGGESPDVFTPGEPTLIVAPIALTPIPDEHYETGVAVITHRNLRELPEAKTTDYLIAVQLIPAMRAAGAIEVLYHDETRMLEGARSGLGIVTSDGVLVTASRDVLESVTRYHVLRIAKELMPVALRDISLGEFHDAPEVFLTGTTRGVLPVTVVDGRPVGNGQVGPHARRLSDAFREHVAAQIG
jgi:D-alanine transaminase/branched-chain amino acid aminotransferase